jgi:hypothetical protein
LTHVLPEDGPFELKPVTRETSYTNNNIPLVVADYISIPGITIMLMPFPLSSVMQPS